MEDSLLFDSNFLDCFSPTKLLILEIVCKSQLCDYST